MALPLGLKFMAAVWWSCWTIHAVPLSYAKGALSSMKFILLMDLLLQKPLQSEVPFVIYNGKPFCLPHHKCSSLSLAVTHQHHLCTVSSKTWNTVLRSKFGVMWSRILQAFSFSLCNYQYHRRISHFCSISVNRACMCIFNFTLTLWHLATQAKKAKKKKKNCLLRGPETLFIEVVKCIWHYNKDYFRNTLQQKVLESIQQKRSYWQSKIAFDLLHGALASPMPCTAKAVAWLQLSGTCPQRSAYWTSLWRVIQIWFWMLTLTPLLPILTSMTR